MNCPKCVGANFAWAKKCDHCGYVFAEGARQLLEPKLPINRQSTGTPTVTVGEAVKANGHESAFLPVQKCLLCEATATVVTAGSEVRIVCDACGHYRASAEAARALGALEEYRVPALRQMRMLVAKHRQNRPDAVPRIVVKYIVSEGVPTFGLSD
jgi:hypothetical protein